MNNDYNDIKEKVEQIFKDIAEESLSLEDVDLGSILKEWKDLCQTLDSKAYQEIPENENKHSKLVVRTIPSPMRIKMKAKRTKHCQMMRKIKIYQPWN